MMSSPRSYETEGNSGLQGARNENRSYQRRRNSGLEDVDVVALDSNRPDRWIVCSDEFRRLNEALAQLPYDQREAVILRAQNSMKFRQIAESQHVPMKTVQSRYREGLNKLRSLLNSEVTK
jgi:RNA polymerase sigma factor (sigma-70 family)